MVHTDFFLVDTCFEPAESNVSKISEGEIDLCSVIRKLRLIGTEVEMTLEEELLEGLGVCTTKWFRFPGLNTSRFRLGRWLG